MYTDDKKQQDFTQFKVLLFLHALNKNNYYLFSCVCVTAEEPLNIFEYVQPVKCYIMLVTVALHTGRTPTTIKLTTAVDWNNGIACKVWLTGSTRLLLNMSFWAEVVDDAEALQEKFLGFLL